MVIDQKRAHERVLYERFLESLGNNQAVSQAEIFPVTAAINPSDFFLLKEMEEDLRLLGFSISYSGDNTIVITGRPSGTASENPLEMLEILLEDYKNSEADPSKGAREKLAAGMACASAIPYGKLLNRHEMEELIDTLFACASPNYSPKGKPVISIITLDEIDKRFK
jgi:DNA mismatch repair protein MutL